MIKRICVICEGQTEETFVRDVLAPAFQPIAIFINARLIPTSPGHKGGALNYNRVQQFIYKTLREDKSLFVTTLFDLYKIPPNFPNYSIAKDVNLLAKKLGILTSAMHEDIVKLAKCDQKRFIPYIQPYEFEALLFSDVDILTSLELSWKKATSELNRIRQQAQSPEHINNHKDTTPSAHLKKNLNPSYDKVADGWRAAAKIGLTRIEQECQFFSVWLNKLRNLSELKEY